MSPKPNKFRTVHVKKELKFVCHSMVFFILKLKISFLENRGHKSSIGYTNIQEFRTKKE